MKRNKLLLFISLCLIGIGLMSCQDQVRPISGTYSYKISGTVRVDGTQRTLSTEQGAMEIVRIDNEKALVTFNILAGDVYHTNATIENKQITFEPYERDITIFAETYHVTAKGKGDIYDGTIIVSLEYSGDGVQTSRIELLCKKN